MKRWFSSVLSPSASSRFREGSLHSWLTTSQFVPVAANLPARVPAWRHRFFLLLSLFSLPPAALSAPIFMGLGDLPGGSYYSSAYGISADGQTVVGNSYSSSGLEAFRWTPGSGMQGLGDLAGGSFESSARGVSADGQTIVGSAMTASGPEAFRWTAATGMAGLGDRVPGMTIGSGAMGVSDDGQTVVGWVEDPSMSTVAFRWTPTSGMQALDIRWPGICCTTAATGVSADGSVIVGYGGGALVWSTVDTVTSLKSIGWNNAEAVTPDGQIVVGYSGTALFRWTAATGMEALPPLTGNDLVLDVSADGQTVVGTSYEGSGQRKAFIWTEAGGMHSFQDILLNNYGLDLTGWHLSSADGISDDGLTIVGHGTNPSGQIEAWLARLDPQPSNATDSDGDGMPDAWERANDVNDANDDPDNDSLTNLQEYQNRALGADPQFKDVFIEIDYMAAVPESCLIDDVCFGGHPAHKPDQAALEDVMKAFLNQGIRLHIDGGSDWVMDPISGAKWGERSRSNEIPHIDYLGKCEITANKCKQYYWDQSSVPEEMTPDQIKAEYFDKDDQDRKNIFHYAIFAHQLGKSGTSGISRETPSNDFIVTLGAGLINKIGTPLEQAGTFMHELGHNLGLCHGGPQSLAGPDLQCDVNYKPNHLSVMNYSFQQNGLRVDGKDGYLDYALSSLTQLSKDALNEDEGIFFGSTPDKVYGTRFYCNHWDDVITIFKDRVVDNGQSIDWNCNLLTGGIVENFKVNKILTDPNADQSEFKLNSYEEWSQLKFDGNGTIGQFGSTVTLPSTTIVDELAVDEAASMSKDYYVVVKGPGPIYGLPGKIYHIGFEINNLGELADTYRLTANTSSPWVNLNAIPTSLPLDSKNLRILDVSVTIPVDAATQTTATLSLIVTSSANPLIRDTVSVSVTVSVSDTDGDGVADEVDNCPNVPNPDQTDRDSNGKGNACDNQPPTANAGISRSVRLNSLITLDGSASRDPDNAPQPLSYAWTKSAGSSITLNNPGTMKPSFTPNIVGSYMFSLIVGDGAANSDPSSVVITVPKLGDIDGDGDVDNNDLNVILAARNKPASSPNDLRDLDGNMKIDALDARKLTTLCTRPRCATQ